MALEVLAVSLCAFIQSNVYVLMPLHYSRYGPVPLQNLLSLSGCLRSVFCFIPEAQPQTPVKDKSPWRKSNLNVPNSAEETELDMRRLRRMQSRGSVDAGSTSPNPLQVHNYCEMLLLQM